MKKVAKKNVAAVQNVSSKRIRCEVLSIIILAVFSFININGLSKEACVALGIFFASLCMWIGVAIDWPSILSIFLIGLLPSFGFSKALSTAFGNSTVLFLLFTFMLVYPLSKTNFIRRVSLWFIQNDIAKKGPWYFITFLFVSIFVLGLFISPSVLFVAFMPFLQDIYDVLDIKKGTKIGNALMMGTAFIISLSSGATPIGHVWPTLVMTAVSSSLSKNISVFQYMCFGVPCGVILLILLVLILKYLYKPDVSSLKVSNVAKLGINNKEIKKDGKKSKVNANKIIANKKSNIDEKEKIILVTLLFVVILWVVPSLIMNTLPNVYKFINGLTTAMPPMLGCIILFLYHDENDDPILSFNDVMKNGIYWGAIFMTGAATLIGSLLTDKTLGISVWISDVMAPISQSLPSNMIVLFFVAWVIIQTNFSSNIVTTTTVSSIALLVLANNQNVDVVAICMLIGFGAAICNMTPAGQSTINTVAISSGYTDTKSMFVWGGVFAVVAIIVLSFVGYPLFCAVG